MMQRRIEEHEEVDTPITGAVTFTLHDGARELARLLPDGRVIVNAGTTIPDLVRVCGQAVKEMAASSEETVTYFYVQSLQDRAVIGELLDRLAEIDDRNIWDNYEEYRPR